MGDAQRGVVQVGVGADDGRRLAAQFQRDRREPLGRRPHHLPPHARVNP